jgi:GMP synthase (glutamine-hydrolysing)
VRVLAIVHDADAGPGVFAQAVADRGGRLDEWDLPRRRTPPGDPRAYDAVLSFGGAVHPDQEARHPWLAEEKRLLAELLALGRPLLGVCLGAQLLAEAAGARTHPASRPEVGWYWVRLTGAAARDPVLGPLAPDFQALEWHSYEFALPPGAVELARSAACLQAFRLVPRAWGIQFHAEVTLSDFTAWIDHERSPEERERLGFDPTELRARTLSAIGGWNRLGRELCGRFLDAATA